LRHNQRQSIDQFCFIVDIATLAVKAQSKDIKKDYKYTG
jgi:hypothetical protein